MKFLFVHTWGLGDLIMFTPALKALKDKYPQAQIDFLITVKAAAVPLKKCALAHKIYFASNSLQGFLKLVPTLRLEKYDYGMATSGITPWKAQLFLSLLNIDHPIGEFRSKPSAFVFKKQYKFNPAQHRLDGNLQLLSQFIPPNIERKPFFCLDERDLAFADEFLATNGLTNNKLFGIHPGCNKDSFYRRWPKEHYIKLIKILQERGGLDLLLFIGPDEEDLGKEIVAETSIIVANKCSMYQTAALLSKCDFFLNSDSGLGHVASCFKAQLFIIFGPADDRLTAPLSDKCHILRSKIPTPPQETWLNLKEVPQCLTEFYPHDVYELLKAYL
ncbi:glycosyltransferase family 9 protein [bacterium]|nr:glycosyltransferase family 9 protein [bacterium]